MSAATSLKELTCSPRLGGGSVLRLPEVSELIGHLEEGRLPEERLEEMAAVPRGPTPAEWETMRAGEQLSVPEPTPEPEPAPVEETPTTEEPVSEAEESETEEEPGDDDDTEVTPV